jgi:ABC-type transport system involved in multi-copper enzyme maturation permease subunit
MATPVQPDPDASLRPVPWRGMAWVSWRQHRAALAGLVAALGAAGLYLYVTGLHIHHEVIAYGEMFTANGSGKMNMTPTAALFQVIPALIGAFVGAPMVARELETGTFRFAWTQGFGRTRWAAAKLVQLAVAVTVVAGAFGFLFSWCYGPIIGVPQGLSPLMSITFDLRGVSLAAWALVAFAIGALAGVLIRRVVPAMAATLAAWSGLAVMTGVFLRRHYESPLVTRNPNLPTTAWVIGQRWTLHGKPVSLSTVNQVLQKIGAREFAPGLFGPAPPPGGQTSSQFGHSAGSTSGNVSPAQYLLHHGFTQLISYQPASRFWPFQFIEGGLLLALSLLLITATVWLVRRRAA